MDVTYLSVVDDWDGGRSSGVGLGRYTMTGV